MPRDGRTLAQAVLVACGRTFSSRPGIALSRYDATAGEWTAPVRLEAGSDTASEPLDISLTMDPENRLYASWTRLRNIEINGVRHQQLDLFTAACVPD
jgi:hypothetical protein